MIVGLNQLWIRANSPLRIAMLVICVITLANTRGIQTLWHPLKYEESKPVLSYLETHKGASDLIFVQHDGIPAFHFYNELCSGCS